VIILLCTSCGSTRKAVYFDNIQDATIPITIENLEPVLQKNDLLSISVGSLNRTASEAFNAPNSSGTLTQASGYLIDQDGNIKFPVLGTIKAAGITKKALGDYITKSLIESKQLLDPVVTVRYLNFKVTVLGEVARPMVVSVPNEKITLLEALGTAGDLTLFARRNNVLILRDEANSRIVKRIDLNSRELLTSPYFNLKSNDVIYVEPNKAKVASTTRTTQLLPIILSGLSVLFVVVERYIGNN
jgi:polysaccharide export outer membrane protein